MTHQKHKLHPTCYSVSKPPLLTRHTFSVQSSGWLPILIMLRGEIDVPCAVGCFGRKTSIECWRVCWAIGQVVVLPTSPFWGCAAVWDIEDFFPLVPAMASGSLTQLLLESRHGIACVAMKWTDVLFHAERSRSLAAAHLQSACVCSPQEKKNPTTNMLCLLPLM